LFADHHTIKKQVLDITLNKEDNAYGVQTEVSDIYRSKILPIIDEVFTEIAGENMVLKIDKLEFNLGDIDYNFLEDELVVKMRKQLREQLEMAVVEKEVGGKEVITASSNQSELELILHFLDTGIYPWWAKNTLDIKVDELLANIIRQSPETLLKSLKKKLQQRECCQRLVYQFPLQLSHNIIDLLVPEFSKSIEAIIYDLKEILAQSEVTISISSKEWDERLWLFSVEHLFKDVERIINQSNELREQELIQVLLLEIALAEGQNQQKVLVDIQHQLEQIIKGKRISSSRFKSNILTHIPQLLKQLKKGETIVAAKRKEQEDSIAKTIEIQEEKQSLSETEEAPVTEKSIETKSSDHQPENLETDDVNTIKGDQETIEKKEESPQENEELAAKRKDETATDTELKRGKIESEKLDAKTATKPESELESVQIDDEIIEEEEGQLLKEKQQKDNDLEEVEPNKLTANEPPETKTEVKEEKVAAVEKQKVKEKAVSVDEKQKAKEKAVSADEKRSQNKEEATLENQLHTDVEGSENSPPKIETKPNLEPEIDTEKKNTTPEITRVSSEEKTAVVSSKSATEIDQKTPDKKDNKTDAESTDKSTEDSTSKTTEEIQQSEFAEMVMGREEEISNYFTPVEEKITECYIENAGIVLMWPFLANYFKQLELVAEGQFISPEKQQRAAMLLQYMAVGKAEIPEHLLVLNKLLCNMKIYQPVPKNIAISAKEKKETEAVLAAAINNWKALNKMSVNGFRGSFLIREGILRKQHNGWLLTIEKKTYDILMDQLPWPVSVIKCPWMKQHILVEW
jgi:hypothetical protein